MKVLKYIGIGLLVILVIVLVLGLIAPNEAHFERSIVVNASRQTIIGNIKSLQNMQKWNPWAELDSNMKNTFEGKDGEVGSKNSWSGNDKVGEGSQIVTAIAENEILMDLHFIRPFESDAKIRYTFAEEKDGIKVTWGFTTRKSYPFNGIMMVMMKLGAMNKDFDHGLAKLKALCESAPAEEVASPTYEIHEMDMEAKNYVGKREMVGFMDFGKFYGENFGALMTALGTAKIQPTGALCGVFYSWDEKNMKADVAAAAPVADAKTSIKGYTTFTVPAGKALHVAYYGAYEKSEAAHKAIDAYMKEKNLQMAGHVVEEYVTNPMSEPDTAKWLTNIYYMVK